MKNYTADHPYQKEANQFINALKKKKALMAERLVILKPILDKFNVDKDWDIPREFWRSFDWATSPIKMELEENSRKFHTANKRATKLKYSYWAVEPNGERWGKIYPKEFKHKQEMKAQREQSK